MDTRTVAERVGSNVAQALATAGVSPETLAEATDIDCSDLESHLIGATDFTFLELVSVGGFLRLPTHSLLEGIE